MAKPPLRKVRCAVYTRKSSEEGLEQEFNSLDAQREACEAYVSSQRHEGWVLVPDRYDDGGKSGGSLERPALQRLLQDIGAGRIDTVVVYKIDRLTRSLMDFAKLVEVFDRQGTTFVSITQQFNTTTSMGRLTLNILLSFAQFEREVIGERIRDKFAASRRKGMWMGGRPPLGYDVKDRKLVINKAEADLIRRVFELFMETGSSLETAKRLNAEGHTTKSWTTAGGNRRQGKVFDKATVHKLLINRVYLGEVVHKGESFLGEHKAIIDQATWDKARGIFGQNSRTRGNRTRARTPALLKGLIFAPNGRAMTPTHTRKKGKLYRYYVATNAIKSGYDSCPIGCVPAAKVEEVVLQQLRGLIRSPELIARTWAAVRDQSDERIAEREIREALAGFDALWDELFPAEQSRLVQLLVERIEVRPNGIEVRLRAEGLKSLLDELRSARPEAPSEAA